MAFFNKIIITLLILIAAVARGEDRPAYFEFSPAYPKEIQPFQIDQYLPNRFKEFIVTDTIYLDQKGNIDTLLFEDTTQIFLNQYIFNYLKELKFEPAKFKGKKIKSILPIKVHHRPGRSTIITYPVDDSLQIKNQKLYYDAARVNNVSPPELVMFPPVFCDLTSADTMPGYQYIIVKVDIDSTGRAYNMELDRSTYPSFEHQIKYSTLYAEYKPAVVMGEKVNSSAYLVVRFFEEIHYPTQNWRTDNKEQMNYLERNLIELIPEKIGYLSPPIVRNAMADKVKYADFKLQLGQDLTCWLMVDDFGQMYIRRMSAGIRKNSISKVKEQFQKTKFYPALDFDGNWVVTEGLVNIKSMDESYVRITYTW